MNSLVWNCRGAGARTFPASVKDLMRIYRLDFIAILEPRVSGSHTDDIIRRTGLHQGARVEARGFAGGIWCLWRHSCPPIQVISFSNFCVHLCVNPASPNCWVFFVVYASPQRLEREEVWCELLDFGHSIHEPWCVAGDFNQVLYSHEKQGGSPFNRAASDSFAQCINGCHLVDMGFKGHLFTWKRGDLKERLDRVWCTTGWQACFPNSSVTHLPLARSDHCGLWLRTSNQRIDAGQGSYFKFLSSWLEHPDFGHQVSSSWVSSDSWGGNIQRLTSNLRDWNREVFGHIFKRKHRIIKRLEGIANKLLEKENHRLVNSVINCGLSTISYCSKRKRIGINWPATSGCPWGIGIHGFFIKLLLLVAGVTG